MMKFIALYFSLNIFRVIKSRGGEVSGTCGKQGGGERCLQGFEWEAPKGTDHWKDLDIGGRITLRWILGK
jgi:hypothetical protein